MAKVELTKWEQAKLNQRKSHKQRMAQAVQEWKSTLRKDLAEKAIEHKGATSAQAKAKLRKKAAKSAAIITSVFDKGWRF